jgi:hypothetical protein
VGTLLRRFGPARSPVAMRQDKSCVPERITSFKSKMVSRFSYCQDFSFLLAVSLLKAEPRRIVLRLFQTLNLYLQIRVGAANIRPRPAGTGSCSRTNLLHPTPRIPPTGVGGLFTPA